MTFKPSQIVRVKATGQTGVITTIAKHPSWKSSLVFVRILGESNAYGVAELELVQEPNPTVYHSAVLDAEYVMRPEMKD